MKLKESYRNKKLTSFAKKNRTTRTHGENKLWQRLRNKNTFDYKFRRQVPILNFIVDFYCESLKLVIEVDGSSHDDIKFEYDIKRENLLKSLGLTILRFTEYDVRFRTLDVLQTIENYIYEYELTTSP